MRIAIFSDTFPPQTNGVANTVWQSARNLVDLGHEVAIFTVSKTESMDNENDPRLRIFYLPSVSAMAYPDERVTAPVGQALMRLKKFDPDIIHTHTPFTVGLEALLCAKILKKPLVGTNHTFYDHYLKHIKMDYEWGKKMSWKITIGYYNFCDMIISPSRSLCDSMTGQGLRKPVEVLVNSIDTRLFSPAARDEERSSLKQKYGISEKSLCYMGRISYEKNIDVVLKTFALISKKMPGLKLMVIGDGPEKETLQQLAQKLGIKNDVIFTGVLYGQDLVDALRANDLYLSACNNENMPLATLEVMATGLPVVCVKEKGFAEIIKENANGLFCKTDMPEDMAEKAVSLLSDEHLLREFSLASRELALDYSHEKIGKKLEELYKRVIESFSD